MTHTIYQFVQTLMGNNTPQSISDKITYTKQKNPKIKGSNQIIREFLIKEQSSAFGHQFYQLNIYSSRAVIMD